jgi:hypothetical protein
VKANFRFTSITNESKVSKVKGHSESANWEPTTEMLSFLSKCGLSVYTGEQLKEIVVRTCDLTIKDYALKQYLVATKVIQPGQYCQNRADLLTMSFHVNHDGSVSIVN